MNELSIRCKQLQKSYKGFHLGPIDATFPPGKVTGVFGPNGAGKTTLISLLIGAVKKESGVVLPSDGVTYGGVFDQPFLLPHTRVIDQIDALCDAVGLDSENRDSVVAECGLQPYLNRRVVKLSTGNRQRLALALALIQNPDVFVLDEPLNGLDPEGIEWFHSKMKNLATVQKIVLLATHLLAEAEAITDRCIFLMEGRVIYEGDVSGILASIGQSARYICTDNESALENSCNQDVVYRDRELLILHDPAMQVSGGLPLADWGKEKHISLSALYRLKVHDFLYSEGDD